MRNTFEYKEKENELIPKADMNKKRTDHSLTYLNGHIYAVGSCNKKRFSGSCEKYNVEEDKWTLIAPMNVKRSGVGLCTFNDKYLFAFGGRCEESNSLNTIESYHI